MMNDENFRNMNSRFFAEFIALLSLRVSAWHKAPHVYAMASKGTLKKISLSWFLTLTFIWWTQVNPDPYVECDPEVDIDKAQAEEDANYFDEEDLGNLTSIQSSWNIFILRVLELFDFSAEQHFGTEARGRFFHRGNDFSQKK